MRIGYLVPGVGLDEQEVVRRSTLLDRVGGDVLAIKLLEVDEGPAAIETAEDEVAAVRPVLKLAKAEQRNYDAFIIGCFGDVGIDALRKAITIPIIGPARTTYSIAAAAFPTFSILSLNSGFIEGEKMITRRLGVSSQVKEIDALNLPVDRIIVDPEQALARITLLTEQLDDYAVVLGCMSMAFLLEEKGVSQIGRTHVINPLRCAVRAATAMLM